MVMGVCKLCARCSMPHGRRQRSYGRPDSRRLRRRGGGATCKRGVSLSDSRSRHQRGQGNRSFDDACNCAGDSGGKGYGSAAEEQTTEVPSATAETRTVTGQRAGTTSSLRASRAAKHKNAKLRKEAAKQEAAAKYETQVDGTADANQGNGEPVVQRECSVQCPSGQSEVGALSPAQSPPTAIVAATRDLAQGDIVQLKNFTQHA